MNSPLIFMLAGGGLCVLFEVAMVFLLAVIGAWQKGKQVEKKPYEPKAVKIAPMNTYTVDGNPVRGQEYEYPRRT